MAISQAEEKMQKGTVVIKVGSSSIVNEETGNVSLSTLSGLVETIAQLKRLGHSVVLVSSGAVGVGCLRLKLSEKPKDLQYRQALAAIGQGCLMRVYEDLFSQVSLTVAQVLLTRSGFSEKLHFENARNTFLKLMELDVVPIVNEDDTNSVEELRFGDNDTLSALVCAMVDANWLFLLTDVDALYTANPNADPDAKPIREVSDINELEERISISGTGSGSQWGTGGMETKITAARLATALGCRTVISKATSPGEMAQIIAGSRSLGTVFHPAETTVEPDRRWISHGLKAQGRIMLSAEGVNSLHDGRSLTLEDIVNVEDNFDAQEAVQIVDEKGHELARGLTGFSSADLEHLVGESDDAASGNTEASDLHANDVVISNSHIALMSSLDSSSEPLGESEKTSDSPLAQFFI